MKGGARSSGGRAVLRRGFLEYHDVVPYADGGPAVADNVQLRCRAHNADQAARSFGVKEDLVREVRGPFEVQRQCDDWNGGVDCSLGAGGGHAGSNFGGLMRRAHRQLGAGQLEQLVRPRSLPWQGVLQADCQAPSTRPEPLRGMRTAVGSREA